MLGCRFLGEQNLEDILNVLDMFNHTIQGYLYLHYTRNRTNK
jgi:hypothetical protein